jgi:transcriptional regulator with XRE-family HTH domain
VLKPQQSWVLLAWSHTGGVECTTLGGDMPAYTDDDLLQDSPFTRLVGERLRRIRQQKQWSLSEVEANSDSEFKASVLGAYERGERAISVPRLERLARFYGVSIDQLLPRDTQRMDDTGSSDGAPKKLRIDVAKLSAMSGAQFEMLERFLRMIQVQRQDFNGKVITVRAHDTRAIAVMLDVPVDNVGEKLSELELLFVPPAA